MSFVIRFIDTRECIFVDDLLAYWQTKVNEYDREIRVVVKKKENLNRMDRRIATHLEKFEKFIRVQATVEAGEESIQFESYVCEVIPPICQNILSRQRQHIDRELI